MAVERNENNTNRKLTIRHRGRIEQIGIYLGKMLRMFVYQSDWKVVPMAVLIAGLVGMVIRSRLFINREGTLTGAFCMVMVCIWNGSFNSIQVICRERDVIKREHRSGMHISSYIVSHMIYQALLCLIQTGVTLYVTRLVGVQYPENGLLTPWMIVDFGISMFLITYASDMMSLWISTLSRNTTTAMTIMPFVLIFQLVFSGGMLTLPEWSAPLTNFTISNPALKVLATQGDYNNQPVVTLWNQLNKMVDKEVNVTVSLGNVLDLLENEDIAAIADLRSVKVSDLAGQMDTEASESSTAALQADLAKTMLESKIGSLTLGELIDMIATDEKVQAERDMSYTYSSTVGDLLHMAGEDRVKEILQNEVKDVSYNADYDYTIENILYYWFRLIVFSLAFAALAVITLEFIDKDKR
ncbi:MAG: ABC transporter permease [Blautia sp.]|nr:ABC transporter permease [Blautia sp.]